MENQRLKFRLPFYNNNGEFSHFQYFDIVDGLKPYNAGVMFHRDEYEQCTGLKDKNGSLIYEGDVIQFTHNRGYFTNKGDIRVVEFSAFRFCGFGWRSRPENNVEFALTESAAKKCAVIGNIHEQAEQKDVK